MREGLLGWPEYSILWGPTEALVSGGIVSGRLDMARRWLRVLERLTKTQQRALEQQKTLASLRRQVEEAEAQGHGGAQT